MSLEFILSVLGVIGTGGIIATLFTYILEKKKIVQLKENELKERRYLCILLLMYAYVNPNELKTLKRFRPEIQNKDDLKRELQTEWVNSWVFAGDNTIKAFKIFLESPTENNFAGTVLSMRKELWNKKTKLPLSTFTARTVL
ncbi:MAG: hypothetical protein PHC66_04360 [Candidatus Nanoarchaeia archaeon]|nr:hypothetical protein [Candidatus Nanoarchaeia archaeon]MDD5239452.1 hypothetical protein [Candidatus Nanoarchaeia archaeon]